METGGRGREAFSFHLIDQGVLCWSAVTRYTVREPVVRAEIPISFVVWVRTQRPIFLPVCRLLRISLLGFLLLASSSNRKPKQEYEGKRQLRQWEQSGALPINEAPVTGQNRSATRGFQGSWARSIGFRWMRSIAQCVRRPWKR